MQIQINPLFHGFLGKNNFPKNKCHKLIVSNLQRNIMVNNNRQLDLDLFRTDEEKILFNQLKNLNKKIIGYFPTYRVGTKRIIYRYK